MYKSIMNVKLAAVGTMGGYSTLCGSRKYPYPHHRGSLEILRGKGVLKAKIFKGKYEPKLEFPEGWRFKPKTLQGEYGYFLEQHISHL